MAGRPRQHPRVRIEWDRRRLDEAGIPCAALVWYVEGARQREQIGHVSPELAESLRGDREATLRLGLTPTSPVSPQPAPPVTVADAVLHFLDALPTMPGTPEHHRWETTRALHLDRLLGPVALTELTASRLRAYVKKRKGEQNEPRHRGDPDRRRPNGERVRPLPPPSTAGPRRITVVNEIGCLGRVVRSMREAGRTAVIELPRVKDLFSGWEEDHRPPRQLTEAEVGALITAGTYVTPRGTYAGVDRSWVGRLIGFLAWCPRRPVAVFALRLRDCARVVAPGIERKERRVWFERDKGGKGRGWGPLTTPALDYLRTQIEARQAAGAGPDDLVWITEAGRQWDARKWWRVFQGVAERAGVDDVTTYDLRKFGAAQVYRRKPNLKVVMAYTGHKNPAVLLRNYLFPERDEAEAAAEHIGWSAAAMRLVENSD